MIDNLQRQFPFRINSVGVNPCEAPTIVELLNDYYNKIQEVIGQSNSTENFGEDTRNIVEETKKETIDFMEWCKVQGLPDETRKLLEKWYNDGTLEELLNTQKLETIRQNLQGQIDNTNSSLETMENNLRKVEINLNDFFLIAKSGSEEEDWTLAFNHVIENVITNDCVIKWSGNLKVKSTWNVPYGIDLDGSSLPNAGLVPTSDFVGEWCITQLSDNSHINWKNFQIHSHLNNNVRGIYIKNPYDYSSLSRIVGANFNKRFIEIGGEKLSQTLRLEDCVVYLKESCTETPIAINNAQENYICNNKILGQSKINTDMMVCDGVTNTTFINNSFAHSLKSGLILKCETYKKRLIGNTVIANLFENVEGEFTIVLKSVAQSGITLEGQNNNVTYNNYMGSTSPTILVNYVTNTMIIDAGKVVYGGSDRRTFNINPFDQSDATETLGRCELKADGKWFKGNFKGDFNGSHTASLYTFDVGRSATSSIRWNATPSSDYGMIFKKDGVDVMSLEYGDISNLVTGAGIRLKSLNGTTFRLRIGNDGVLYTTQV